MKAPDSPARCFSSRDCQVTKIRIWSQAILIHDDTSQGAGRDGNLPEIGSLYFGFKLSFTLTFNYQPRTIFLEARIRRGLSLLFQPDSEAVSMGRFGMVCACSCPKTGEQKQAEAFQKPTTQAEPGSGNLNVTQRGLHS